MIGKVTTRAILSPQPIDSQVQERLSTSYLINTDAIIEMEDQTLLQVVKTRILYKFNVYDDRHPEFVFTVDDTVSAIKTLADATPASPKLALSVFENVQSFAGVTGVTAVTWYFNVADIVWAENGPSDDYCRIWILKGGHNVVPYIVDHNIDQVIDLADTATTTTTSTSSSSTSTSTSSTSTSSTSSTSTSSTSTSSTSTSSTSTSSTSTSSTSTTTTIA